MSNASIPADFARHWQDRPRLVRLAYRMTGSFSEAEDIVQDAWERMLKQPAGAIHNVPGWLTSVVSRLAIDHLRSARRTSDQYGSPWLPEPVSTDRLADSPEQAVHIQEELGFAILFLLERLSPDQRVVWVLRTSLQLSYAEIADIVEKPAASCRQLFHRASQTLAGDSPAEQPREISADALERFTDAFQHGDIAALTSLLTDDAVWIGDGGTIKLSTSRAVQGAERVARGLVGLHQKHTAHGTEMVVPVNGALGTMLAMGDHLDSVAILLWNGSKISHVLIQRNPEKLGRALGEELAARHPLSFHPER